MEHFRTCNLCEAMCGVRVEHEGPTITRIEGDREDPLSEGHLCPKVYGLKDVHEDADRLVRPLLREGRSWREIGWDEALDRAALGLRAVQARHGRDSVGVYQGNPSVHNHGTMLFGQLFVRALRTKARFSATSLDQLPHMLAALEMFGHQLVLPVPDIDRTDFIILLGANPAVSNGSLLSAPGVDRRLKAIRARGGRVVVVDPRRTETARLADEHLFIRPGTDALWLAALVHLALARGPSLGRLDGLVKGVEALADHLAPFTPEAVAGATGIPAGETRRVFQSFIEAETAVAYGRIGTCTQEFGGLASWLINALNIATGNFDAPGGAMFTKPAIDAVALAARIGQRGHFGRRKTRVRGLPEFGGEYPSAALAEEIDTPGPGQIRGLVTSAGNPVLSAPNGRRLDRALAGLEHMVSIDIYLNETTRHAHLILPPTFGVEHSHYDLAFHIFTARNTAKYSPAMLERAEDARHDWEIFAGLFARLGGGKLERWLRPIKERLLARGPDVALDLLLRTGPYGGLNPFGEGLSLEKLRRAPHGVDLGPLVPMLPDRLYTEDRKIELCPRVFIGDLPRLRGRMDRPAGSLELIGRRDLRTNNSWMHNSERMVRGKDRCTLLMHPEDATRRGLADGVKVVLESRVGRVEVHLEVTDEMMPGVVSLPHGWGHDREGIRLRVASAHPGASVNDVSDEALVDELSGTARFSGVPVEVRRAGA